MQRRPGHLPKPRLLLRRRHPRHLRQGCLCTPRPKACKPAWQTMWALSPRHLAAAHKPSLPRALRSWMLR